MIYKTALENRFFAAGYQRYCTLVMQKITSQSYSLFAPPADVAKIFYTEKHNK